MKVLLFNGSPHEHGCTDMALAEISSQLLIEGIDSDIIWLGNSPINDCIACGGCRRKGKCVFTDDGVNEWVARAREADGFVFGSPVYYAHPTGRILSAMDRMFYSGKSAFAHKPAAVVVSARRAGTTASFDALNKHLTINQMPVVSSTYWNNVHGSNPSDVVRDDEGLQTMRNLARNMAWILRCIKAGKEDGTLPPDAEKEFYTNFIR